MWKCVLCGKENRDIVYSCLNCDALKDGTLLTERKKPAGSNIISAENNELAGQAVWQLQSTNKADPISTAATNFLRVFGWATAILGIVAGIVVIMLAPDGSSEIEKMFRITYYSIGCAEIVGGIVSGVLLNVIAGIGEAVLDMWKAHPGK